MNSQKKAELQQEFVTEQTNAKDTNKSKFNFDGYELRDQVDIEGTPFKLMRVELENDEKEYFTTLGNYRVGAKFKTEEEALKDAGRMDMWRILEVIGIAMEGFHEFKKLEEKINETEVNE